MTAQFLRTAQNVWCLFAGTGPRNGARTVISATEEKVAVGYVVHLPEQNRLFQALFG